MSDFSEVTFSIKVSCSMITKYEQHGWHRQGSPDEGRQALTKVCTKSSFIRDTRCDRKTPYLIQRATIRRPFVDTAVLSNSVNFDYMGSAAFEFGALPTSLHRIKETFFAYTMRPVKTITQEDSWLRVYSRYDVDDFNHYLTYLHALRENKLRLKEWSGFDKERTAQRFNNQPDFWWDIENDVMWTFEKQYAKRLPQFLQNSFDVIS